MNSDPILAWYQRPEPEGTAYLERHLRDADALAEVFALARSGEARFTRHGWKYLWESFGLTGLTAIARRCGCMGVTTDESLADQLIRLSLAAGYDPVSGLFGAYNERTNTFEITSPPGWGSLAPADAAGAGGRAHAAGYHV
jgi:hypothetical protein